MTYAKKIRIAMADDHAMLRKGLIRYLQSVSNYEILFEVNNGNEVIEEMKKHKIPDVLILDINMTGKDGPQTAVWVSSHFPQVKILALSMFSDEQNILKMIQSGAKGYITKNADPEKLKEAIDIMIEKGAYLPENLSLQLMNGIRNNVSGEQKEMQKLSDKEILFLRLLCKELNYQEIATQMFLSPRTIDDYRKKLTRKLNVKGKSGLIVYAMNNGYHNA